MTCDSQTTKIQNGFPDKINSRLFSISKLDFRDSDHDNNHGNMRFRRCLLQAICVFLFAKHSIGDDNNKNPTVDGDSLLDSGTSFLDEFRWLIESGKLSSARKKALEELQKQCPNKVGKNDLAKTYIETFQSSYDAGGDEYLQKIRNSLNQPTLRAKDDSPNCVKKHSDWTTVDPYELWDESCSILPRPVSEATLDSSFLSVSGQNSLSRSSFQEQCCVFTPESWTYLRLPAIFEPAIRVGIRQSYLYMMNSSTTFLNLEQGGYLCPYDVAGILWPTGYMLSLCLGNPLGCPIPELHALIRKNQNDLIANRLSNPNGKIENHPLEPNGMFRNHPLALELGTGIGASR